MRPNPELLRRGAVTVEVPMPADARFDGADPLIHKIGATPGRELSC